MCSSCSAATQSTWVDGPFVQLISEHPKVFPVLREAIERGLIDGSQYEPSPSGSTGCCVLGYLARAEGNFVPAMAYGCHAYDYIEAYVRTVQVGETHETSWQLAHLHELLLEHWDIYETFLAHPFESRLPKRRFTALTLDAGLPSRNAVIWDELAVTPTMRQWYNELRFMPPAQPVRITYPSGDIHWIDTIVREALVPYMEREDTSNEEALVGV